VVVTQNVQGSTGTLPAAASYLLIVLCLVTTLMQAGCGSDPEVAPTAASDVTPASIATVEASKGEALTSAQESSESVVSPMTRAKTPGIVSTETPAVVESVSVEKLPVETLPVATSSDLEKSARNSDAATRLEEQLAAFTIPPAWLDDVQPKWKTSKPWKEARQEIRNLLGKADDASRREGIKLTWDYLQKNDIGDGHEYGMYMFLGHEPLWAIHVYREWLAKDDHSYPPYFGVKALAALYTKHGVFEEAEKVLTRSKAFKSPDPKWNEVRAAELNDAFGDLYTSWGKIDQAKASYREAVRLFPLAKPPYGKHLLPRKAKKVQAKLDLLSTASLDGASLSDGQYKEIAFGYSSDVQLVVQVKGGRMVNVRVTKHEEKIDQDACILIPQRMSDTQSLQVDGVSGATVTRDAIVSGTLNALKKAGLE